MKSAYGVLGIPQNASPEDIDAAFARVREGTTNLTEAKQAYEILREPATRIAHDRKLAADAVRTRVVRHDDDDDDHPDPVRTTGRYIKWGVVLVAVMFGAGLYVQQHRQREREEQAAVDAVAHQRELQEIKAKRLASAREESDKQRAQAQQEADDRRFAAEGRMAGARASYQNSRMESQGLMTRRMADIQAQQESRAAQQQEQREAYEAQMRVERDKQRVRQLCLQRYGRADC
jgi:hypothetical protein